MRQVGTWEAPRSISVITGMLYRALVLALAATAHGWNQCEGPQVDWMALDEGVGKSASYAVAAMNGSMYSAGYTKGNFAFVGVTDGADVNPVPSATLWGDTASDAQVRVASPTYLPPPCQPGAHTTQWVGLSHPSPATMNRTSTLRR